MQRKDRRRKETLESVAIHAVVTLFRIRDLFAEFRTFLRRVSSFSLSISLSFLPTPVQTCQYVCDTSCMYARMSRFLRLRLYEVFDDPTKWLYGILMHVFRNSIEISMNRRERRGTEMQCDAERKIKKNPG